MHWQSSDDLLGYCGLWAMPLQVQIPMTTSRDIAEDGSNTGVPATHVMETQTEFQLTWLSPGCCGQLESEVKVSVCLLLSYRKRESVCARTPFTQIF